MLDFNSLGQVVQDFISPRFKSGFPDMPTLHLKPVPDPRTRAGHEADADRLIAAAALAAIEHLRQGHPGQAEYVLNRAVVVAERILRAASCRACGEPPRTCTCRPSDADEAWEDPFAGLGRCCVDVHAAARNNCGCKGMPS